jgi:rod shape-determining protein MreC
LAVYRRPSRARYVLTLLVLASITLITLDARGSGVLGGIRGDARSVLDPVTNATHDALAPVGNFLTGAANYGSLKKENDRLRTQIAGMQSNASVTGAAQAEASALIAQADLPFATNVAKVPAAVIGQGPANFDVSLEIDKGSRNGLAVGYPVVTAAGLVGEVAAVTAHTATIRVLTDPIFTIGVEVAPGSPGVATGAGPANPLQVTGVPPTLPVKQGAILTSSGLSLESFPPGIPVGRVTSVSRSPGALQETLGLSPLMNPAQLLTVSVLIYSGQTP